jgi:hypothetical protein
MLVSLPDQLTYHTYIIQAATLALEEHYSYSQDGGKRAATRRGKSARKRARRSVAEIYHCLGPIYFPRAYRMSYDSFWRLLDLLEVKIEEAAAAIRGYLPKE